MTVVKIKRRKALDPAGFAQQPTLLTDEFDAVLIKYCNCENRESDGEGTCLGCGKRIDSASREPEPSPFDIVQRPNAVIRNGGPHLLRGLMLPLCPSSNRYWTQMIMPKKGSTYPIYIRTMREIFSKLRSIQFPSTDAKAYVASIKELAIQRGFMFNTEKPLRIDVVVCPRDKREIDAHNYTKVLLDAFEQAQVYANDSQVIDLRTRVGPIIKGGRLVVSMWEVQSDPNAVLNEAWQ